MKGSVRILFFSSLKEAMHASQMWVEIEEGVQAGDLMDCLKSEYPKVAPLLAQSRIAVNRQIVGQAPSTGSGQGQGLKDGDEVAFLLPVSGG